MADTERLQSRLVTIIGDAAGSSTGWLRVLEEVSSTFGCNFGGFLRWGSTIESHIGLSVGLDEQGLQAYQDHFAAVNPWIIGTAGKFRDGVVLPTEALVSDAEFLRSEFYNDYARYHGGRRGLAAQIDSHSGHLHLSLVRASATHFSSSEQQLLADLIPHLRSALVNDAYTTTLRAHCTGIRESLDALPEALFVEDKIPYANASAIRLTTAFPSVFDWTHGQLSIAHRPAHLALRQRVAAARRSRPVGLPITLHVPHHGSFRLQVLSGFSGAAWAQLRPPIIVVTRTRPDDQVASELMKCWQLTTREAQVTVALRRVGSLGQAARALQIRVSTARVHLGRIFEKCGVGSQKDLLALVRRVEARE